MHIAPYFMPSLSRWFWTSLYTKNPREKDTQTENKKNPSWTNVVYSRTWFTSKKQLSPDNQALCKLLSVHQNKAASKPEAHRQAKHSCEVSNWTDYFSTYNYPGFPLPPYSIHFSFDFQILDLDHFPRGRAQTNNGQ